MKKIIISIVSLFTLLLLVNCQNDDFSFGSLEAPSNLNVVVEIIGETTATPEGDGSGLVKFSSVAENAISYKYVFSDGTSQNSPSGVFEKRFTQPGIHTYTVTIIASGKGGISTNTSLEVTVLSTFEDAEAVQLLTGGSNKKWYVAAAEPGHLGVGPNNSDATVNYYPNYYQAAAFEKAGAGSSSCLYDNVLTFSLDGGQLKFSLDNGGRTFFNSSFLTVGGGSGNEDTCYDYATTGLKTVTLSPSESVITKNPDHLTQTRGTMLNFTDNGFMGYYMGQSSYEIISITANRMVVRGLQGNDSGLAWYQIFTTTPPTQTPDVDFTTLVWSDDFNVDGAPDASKWAYDLGTGDNGWGNGEAQSYTSSSNNVSVQGGNLKITAIKTGSNYSSARLKTEGLFDFTYGKMEVRAKLPIGGGTWPAIWMLGADYATNAWPACGEIDVMEHKGNEPNVIHSTLHFPGNSGGNPITKTTTISNASSAFHIYKVIWSQAKIQFYVDDVLFHSFANSSTVPFNKDFFIILNLAMGGTFGGTIDPAFTQASMEIDYVKVYQ